MSRGPGAGLVAVPGQMSFDELLPGGRASPPPPIVPAPPVEPPPVEPPPVRAEPELALEPEPGLTAEAEAELTVEREPGLAVEVIRSTKRRKTAQARLVGSTVEIRIPSRCSREEEDELVEHFRSKFERARSGQAIDLTVRARELATEYGLPEPSSIRWVSNQRYRWGSCTPVDGSIRLSDRMAGFPPWVIDYVIVHELAHLVEDNHSAAFWALVNAYPLTERARGYLLAMSSQE